MPRVKIEGCDHGFTPRDRTLVLEVLFTKRVTPHLFAQRGGDLGLHCDVSPYRDLFKEYPRMNGTSHHEHPNVPV
jgi:hypothetical protein